MEKNNEFLIVIGIIVGIVIFVGIFAIVKTGSLSTGQSIGQRCTDTDGGLNVTLKGTATDMFGSSTDRCKDVNNLKEWTCERDLRKSYDYICSQIGYSGCADGRCGCIDNDDDGYAKFGSKCGLLDCNDNNPKVNPGALEMCGNNIDDNCNGKIDSADICCHECSTIGERKCDSQKTFKKCGNWDTDACLEWKKDNACPEDRPFCSEGKCVTSLKCKDSDYGINPGTAGKVTVTGDTNVYKDRCLNSTNIKEFFCTINDVKESKTLKCDNTCTYNDAQMAYCKVSGTSDDKVCNWNEDCRNKACKCADNQFCKETASGWQCRDCSTACDNKCQSPNCDGIDPDCGGAGCCGDGICEYLVEYWWTCATDCPHQSPEPDDSQPGCDNCIGGGPGSGGCGSGCI